MAKFALLIGVSEYGAGIPALPECVVDIDEMQRVLRHPEMGGFAKADVLKNPQRQEMEDAIYELFNNCQKDDLLLFYFSGHGMMDENENKLHLGNRDTRNKKNGNLYEPSAVSAEFINKRLNCSRSKRLVLILDCCYSGAFAEEMTKGDSSINLENYLGGKGRAILTSSSASERSLGAKVTTQQGNSGLSIYTRYLIEGIETGAADLDNDGFIGVEELHKYASKRVQEAAPAMNPKFYQQQDEGCSIILAKSPKDDSRLKYRKEVEKWVEPPFGKISRAARELLELKSIEFGISEDEARSIEAEELQPYREYANKLAEYENVLITEASESGYPFRPLVEAALKDYQQELKLRDEDIAEICQRVLPQCISISPDPILDSSISKILPATSSRQKQHQLNVVSLSSNQPLLEMLVEALQTQVTGSVKRIQVVAKRIEIEIDRICAKSDRIQQSGISESWRIGLARHRISKYLYYYQLGSWQGRIELHSHLSSIVYRYITIPQSQLGFEARWSLIEDFLQEFYTESLKVFRRDNELGDTYIPRSLLELAEYMVFTECYAKRRIHLKLGSSQKLIVLRAQTFANRQLNEISADTEKTFGIAKDDEVDFGSKIMQQIRANKLSDNADSTDGVLLKELITYFQAEDQPTCVDYLLLKMEDISDSEIEKILGLTTRTRGYLQQKFKYYIEKFARINNWKLVHEWLDAEIDRKLGLTDHQWDVFAAQLSIEQKLFMDLKQSNHSDQSIMNKLRLTEKKFKLRWSELLQLAAQIRNQ
jgi:Caspase domain